MSKPRVVAFVPAKGSSERIPNKNLAVLDGEYLFKRKLRQLLDCPEIDEVILDTEDDTLAELAADLPVRRLRRPLQLAENTTDGHELFAWECKQVEAEIYLQSLCTAPFVDARTVTRALGALQADPSADSLVAVSQSKLYTWRDGEPQYGRGRIPNSVDLARTTIEAMSLYAVRRQGGVPERRFGLRPVLFELEPQEMVDVNWPSDLALAETIAAGERARENLALGALLPYLSTAMLSDITREMNLTCALPREIRAFKAGKVFGRAKTLELDAVRDGESWQGIYDALNSYTFIRPGDVIMVANRLPDHAYFGNLNAQLAMRAGAIGAVIDGVTRDKDKVEELGFPVWAHGHYFVDIKFKGLLRSMNKPITIGSVRVENGDYVFGDLDGVVVIPFRIWPEVRHRALDGIEREWHIGRAAALGEDGAQIHRTLGDF